MAIDHSRFSTRDRVLFWLWRWVSQVGDPLYSLRGLREFPRFFAGWKAYSKLDGAEPIHVRDAYPQLHDRTTTHGFDAHYFYVNAWAMRRIVAARPKMHVDIGSQPVVAGLLSAVLPVTFLDYRPLAASIEGLTCIGASILDLPFPDRSRQSLSCLHVAEHIGLGRYGDPLNPEGTRLAARELARVLAPGGNLLFAVPVGKPRLCFNAHRIHAAETIREYFSDLELVEFSAVLDGGRFAEKLTLSACANSVYACGMFWFRRPADVDES